MARRDLGRGLIVLSRSLLAGLIVPIVPIAAILLILGVVLPAVWSRKPERREAAFNVLDLLVSSWKATQVNPPAERRRLNRGRR